MRMLHTGEAVPYLRPPRHTLCSGHLARAPPPQHLELLDVEPEELPRSFHNLRARRTQEGVKEVQMRREVGEAREKAVGEVKCMEQRPP